MAFLDIFWVLTQSQSNAMWPQTNTNNIYIFTDIGMYAHTGMGNFMVVKHAVIWWFDKPQVFHWHFRACFVFKRVDKCTWWFQFQLQSISTYCWWLALRLAQLKTSRWVGWVSVSGLGQLVWRSMLWLVGGACWVNTAAQSKVELPQVFSELGTGLSQLSTYKPK